MADLIDRISGVSEGEGRPKIHLHRFMAAQRLYALGEWTRSEIATEFDLQGDEATQASHLADKIDAQTGTANKTVYVLRADAVFMCVEDGDDGLYHNADGTVDKAQVQEDLLL
jgi:hypothetical protein